MIPNYPNFISLDLSHYQELIEFQNKTNTTNCEINTANLYIWQDYNKPTLTKINNNICIKFNPLDVEPFFLEPLGDNKINETLKTCLRHTKKMSLLSESFLNKFKKQNLKIKEQIEHYDYIYLQSDLANLTGRKYDAKRNQINKFKRLYTNYEYSPFSQTDCSQAMQAFIEWYKNKADFSNYEIQKNALKKSLELFNFLNLFGGIIKIHNQISGFSLASKLNQEMVDVHFLYASPIPGLFQTILNETCLNSSSNFKLINLEQDLGKEGIKKSKMSYNPLKLEKKFEITLINLSQSAI